MISQQKNVFSIPIMPSNWHAMKLRLSCIIMICFAFMHSVIVIHVATMNSETFIKAAMLEVCTSIQHMHHRD